jgi:two-component system, chemotaxis family, protein-glutamate methylesterase/glutaminase
MAVRVLIVDDSPFIREVLREGLSQYPDIEIVGEASDGKRAERMVMDLRPDVVTMDVVMPMVGGMDAIRSIMTRCPTPIVVVSDVQGDHNLLSLQAMEAGAIDTFAKPRAGFDHAAAGKLADLLRAAARIRVSSRAKTADPVNAARRPLRQRARRVEFVGIASSTGGPQTLRRFLQELCRQGEGVPPIAIVQHTAVGFAGTLTSWLDSYAGFSVCMAQEGKRVDPGTIVVAPDDRHLEILPGGLVHLSDGPKLGGHRPSGTMLLQSLARSFGSGAAGVVLTGMGSDGAEGSRAIEDQGGVVFVEDPATAIIDGMPRAAIHLTSAPIIASATQIARLLVRYANEQGRR